MKNLAITFAALLLIALQSYQVSSQEKQRHLSNTEAFTKLYGYIRFFHPSDEAQKIDWERFAVFGMQKVYDAGSTEQLREALIKLFLPIAPTLKIDSVTAFPGYEKTSFMPPDVSNLKKVYWQHSGVFLGNYNNVYRSCRVNTLEVQQVSDLGSISRLIDANKYLGKKIRLKGFVKAKVNGASNSAHLWLRVDLNNGKMGFFENMDSRPIILNAWTEYEIIGKVSADASKIIYGAFLSGAGDMWIDELRLYFEENGEWVEIPTVDADFENPDFRSNPTWNLNNEKYRLEQTEKEKYSGQKSILISRSVNSEPQLKIFEKEPEDGELFTGVLNSELKCTFPLVLYADNKGTLPRTDSVMLSSFLDSLITGTDRIMSANNRNVRLADICIAWNIFQHFYPYFEITVTNWNEVLPKFLELAAEDIDEMEFHNVLRKLIAELKDGHGRVGFSKNITRNYPPIIIDYAEGKVVVAKILDAKLNNIVQGDEIIKIDGTDVKEKMKDLSGYISYASSQWLMTRLLNEELINGKDDSEVELTLRSEKGDIYNVVLKRDIYIEQLLKKDLYQEYRPAEISEVKNNIYYVNLDRAKMDAIDSMIVVLSGAKGVIFDMRGYPRGNHDILSHLSDTPLRSAFFSIDNRIHPDRTDNVELDTSSRWNMEPLKPRFKGKIVFLTNRNAISYAESVMGIVEAYDLGIIIGEPTAGTNGNVNQFKLPGGFHVTWTGMNVVKHDGSVHHGVGIIPDIIVKRTVKAIREGRDEMMEKALEIIEDNE